MQCNRAQCCKRQTCMCTQASVCEADTRSSVLSSELKGFRLPQRQAPKVLTRKAPAQALRWMGWTALSRRVVNSARERVALDCLAQL